MGKGINEFGHLTGYDHRFEFCKSDSIPTTPTSHPIIRLADMEGAHEECVQAVDKLRKRCGDIIGVRLAFEGGSDEVQYAQFQAEGEDTVSLTRTDYEERAGGVSSDFDRQYKYQPENFPGEILGFARAVLRYLDESGK